MRLSRIAFLVLLTAVLVGFWVRLSSLPPVIASQFGAGGRPAGWMSRSGFAWFSLIPLGVVAVVTFIAPMMVEKLPLAMLNFPNKEYWLTPERKAEAVRRFRVRMEWFGVALLALIAFVYELVFEANLAQRELAIGPFMVALVAFLLGTIGWIVSLYRAYSLPDQHRG